MKQKVSIPHFIGPTTTATIVIDKNGMTVIDKSETCSDSSVCKGFIKQLIDLDDWNHSWHVDVSSAQLKNSEERKKVRSIMQEKIAEREKEIQMLKNGIQVLGRWNMKTK